MFIAKIAYFNKEKERIIETVGEYNTIRGAKRAMTNKRKKIGYYNFKASLITSYYENAEKWIPDWDFKWVSK